MKRTYVKAIAMVALLGSAPAAHAQVFSNKEVGKKSEALADSLKHAGYPYVLPIWGEKATRRGFSLPYSAGLSVQYLGQRSDLVIENLMVGFNNGTMHDLDGLVRFDKARSVSNGISLRPDVWLFPFLDVYGILARSSASTDVGYGLWLPDSAGNERQVVSLGSKVKFDANTFGLGLTPTIGVAGGWLALDMNFTWTDIPQLDQPATAFVFDPRMGKSFRLRHPDENVNFWVGGFRLAINTGTTGTLPLGDALPIDQWQGSVDQGLQQVEKLNQEIERSVTAPAGQSGQQGEIRRDQGRLGTRGRVPRERRSRAEQRRVLDRPVFDRQAAEGHVELPGRGPVSVQQELDDSRRSRLPQLADPDPRRRAVPLRVVAASRVVTAWASPPPKGGVVSVGMPKPVRAVIGVLVGLLCLYGAVRLAIQGAWAYAVLAALAGVLSFEPAFVMMRVRWEKKRLAACRPPSR